MSDPNPFLLWVGGVLMGVGGRGVYESMREKMEPTLPPDKLVELAMELRESSRRLLQLADITERIANGEDPEDVLDNMPEDVREAFEAYKEGGRL